MSMRKLIMICLIAFCTSVMAESPEIKITPKQLRAEQAKKQKELNKQMAELSKNNKGTKPIDVYMQEHGILPPNN
jgi:cytochrome c556